VTAVEHFVVDTHRDGATVVVVVRGEVDLATAPLLRAVLDSVVGRRPARVEVDLSGASFLDRYALTTLAAVRRRLAARRATLVLRDPSPAASRLLERSAADLEVVTSTPAPGLRRTG
jgi:anti-sigma B factor antagonist